MDTSGLAASAFGGFPGFNPMMMVNISGRCATTRLLQCRGLGVYMNDISRKFEQNPKNCPDLLEADFRARKKVVDQVADWCEKMQGKKEVICRNEWVPILYQYEVVKSSAKRDRDWGHLIFTDLTTTRFLLVMVFPSTCNCGNYSHHDYGALTKYHADRFMSLLKYLYHRGSGPVWVHATYTTVSNNFALEPTFLDYTDSSPDSSSLDPSTTITKRGSLPIFHVTAGNFVPSLLESEVEKIDNLRAQTEKEPVPAAIRAEVLGDKSSRPQVSATWKQKNVRECANCLELKEKTLSVCARCKLVYYCGKECQAAAWPSHKRVCKKA